MFWINFVSFTQSEISGCILVMLSVISKWRCKRYPAFVCDIFRVWSGLHWSARPSLIESCNWIESCNVSFRVHRFVHQKPASGWWSYQRWWRKWFWPELPVIMWIQIPTPHKVRSSLSMLYVWRIIVYSFRCKCWTVFSEHNCQKKVQILF